MLEHLSEFAQNPLMQRWQCPKYKMDVWPIGARKWEIVVGEDATKYWRQIISKSIYKLQHPNLLDVCIPQVQAFWHSLSVWVIISMDDRASFSEMQTLYVYRLYCSYARLIWRKNRSSPIICRKVLGTDKLRWESCIISKSAFPDTQVWKDSWNRFWWLKSS